MKGFRPGSPHPPAKSRVLEAAEPHKVSEGFTRIRPRGGSGDLLPILPAYHRPQNPVKNRVLHTARGLKSFIGKMASDL